MSASNYSITEGSTVITLSVEYLQTLKNGSYTITAEFTDGSATTHLTINADQSNISSSTGSSDDTSSSGSTSSTNGKAPTTEDSIVYILIIMMVASLSLVFIT